MRQTIPYINSTSSEKNVYVDCNEKYGWSVACSCRPTSYMSIPLVSFCPNVYSEKMGKSTDVMFGVIGHLVLSFFSRFDETVYTLQ